MRYFSLLVVLFGLSCCKPVVENDYDLPYEVGIYAPDVYDNAIMLGVNEKRESMGLGVLEYNRELGNIAATHNEWMVGQGVASHDYFTARAQKFEGMYVGECVAYNYREGASVVSAWMGSDRHREKLLETRFTEFACTHKVAGDGKIYVTMMFVGPMPANYKNKSNEKKRYYDKNY
jgi:hypothetical protein